MLQAPWQRPGLDQGFRRQAQRRRLGSLGLASDQRYSLREASGLRCEAIPPRF